MKLSYALIYIILTTLPIAGYSSSFRDSLPSRVTDLSAQEQATWLNRVAKFTYSALLNVPQQGLRAKRADIEQVIAVRQWLEAQRLPLFQLLAIQLQGLVDRALFQEIHRASRTKLGLKIATPLVPNSFDQELLNTLLQANALPEVAWVEYVLTLEGDVINFLKFYQEYQIITAADYLNGKIWFYLPAERRKSVDPKSLESKLVPRYNGLQAFTPNQIGDFLLSRTLRAVDAARDTRLVAQLFLKRGGKLASTSKEFEQLLEEELTLLYGDEKHRTQKRASLGVTISDFFVMDTTGEYSEKNATYYGSKVTWILFKFFTEADWQAVEDKYKQEVGESVEFLVKFLGGNFKPGQWLTFQP
jgi:hypothetical protein